MKKLVEKYLTGDKVIWMVVILLTTISILAVYSSTGTLAYQRKGGNTEYYLFKHLFTLGLGLVIMFLVHRINFKYFVLLSKVTIYIAAPLLLVTMFLGTTVGGASRWLMIPGINLSFQPSDLAKLGLIMYLAYQLAKKQDSMNDFKGAFLPMIGMVALTCGLIFPENFSTASLLFGTSIILLFIGRASLKHLGILFVTGALGLTLMVTLIFTYPEVGRFGTWKSRIESFSSGEESENYQAEHSKMAIYNGKLIGKGPGNSTIKNFLPQAYCDFIYSIVIEEYGSILGGGGILLLYLILLLRAIRIVKKSDGKLYGAFLTIGLTILIVFQALANMAVAVNIVPVTGQTLPLLSMGGTSIWFTSIAIGMILSVSRDVEQENKKQYAVS